MNGVKGNTIALHRTFTDEKGETHVGPLTFKGVKVAKGEESIVPPGCTRFVEGPAQVLLFRSFPGKFTTDYHTDPAQQHQFTFMIEGDAVGDCKDGTSFHLKPGDLMAVEDSVGNGHSARDGGEEGFVQLFIARPANI